MLSKAVKQRIRKNRFQRRTKRHVKSLIERKTGWQQVASPLAVWFTTQMYNALTGFPALSDKDKLSDPGLYRFLIKHQDLFGHTNLQTVMRHRPITHMGKYYYCEVPV